MDEALKEAWDILLTHWSPEPYDEEVTDTSERDDHSMEGSTG